MLSNHPPPSGLQARHRQTHRRQNSTPTAFESMKIAHNSNLPNNTNMNMNMHPNSQQQQPPPPPQQHQHVRHSNTRPRVPHRRGMSLDTRAAAIEMHHHANPSTPTRQDYSNPTVSNQSTNTGLTKTPQHVLREAQQQRIARPGPQQQAFANLASDENYLLSPQGTPHSQRFGGQQQQQQQQQQPAFSGFQDPQNNMNSISFDMFNAQVNMMIKKNQESFSDNNMASSSPEFDLFPTSTMSTPTFMSFNDSPNGAPGWISEGEASGSSKRSSRRISNGIMDRVVKFENMGMEGSQRPRTPPLQQNANNDYFPLTPMETPHNRTIRHRGPQRFSEGYDESMEETIKANHQTPSRRPKTTFDEMRQAAEGQPAVSGPARANTMPLAGQFDAQSVMNTNFLDMNQINAGMGMQTPFEVITSTAHGLPGTSDFSQHTTPITPQIPEFTGPFDQKPDLRPPDLRHELTEDSGSTERPSNHSSPHRRTESVASIASAASIANIDIEQTKTETGVTLDDIHQYIQGPDPRDNKWICTFEDCQKRFGRKENIKSHVQTHLNDRQYKCPTCQKCFVRQHDLKRHAKIHTGIKPYPCECGNSFARHDALTRHKQRGMCIGAFDGVVRKVVKRGRPRKHRPDIDERKEKSARTRKKNKSTSSASSQSGYSDSSAVNSPEIADNNDFDMLDDMMNVSMGGTTMEPHNLQGAASSSAPMPTLTAAASAAANTNNEHTDSPSANSVHSYVSQMSHMSLRPEQTLQNAEQVCDGLASHPGSPAKSVCSQFNEPPELSQSSSPPSCTRFFDMDSNSSGMDAMISTGTDNVNIPSLAGMGDGDNDILLQFTHSGDPNMLMLSSDSKFDEAFESSVDMFTNNDDLFFGST